MKPPYNNFDKPQKWQKCQKLLLFLIITVWFFRSHAWFWSCSFFGSLLDILTHFDPCLQWFATILWVQTRSTRWRSTFDRRNWRYDWWLLGPIAPRWPCRTKVKKLYTITIVFPITKAICNRCCTTKKVVAKCISWRFFLLPIPQTNWVCVALNFYDKPDSRILWLFDFRANVTSRKGYQISRIQVSL